MELSKMALSLGHPATLRLNDLANTLKAEGKSVIHLGGGEPEEKIPESAYAATLEKLNSRYIRYTSISGVPELKDGIAGYTERNYGIKPAHCNIVASSGAKQAIYNFLLSVVNPDDEVVFPAPYWVSYPEMVRMAGGEPVILRPEAGSVTPTLAQFEAAFNQHTKAVMLNSPNNPSGAVFSAELIKGLVELCETRGVWLMMDDIYNRLVFDGQRAPSAYEFSSKPLDESVIVSINGVSKTFSMTGFRIGWSIAPAALTKAMIKVQSQITSCPSALTQAAAAGALSAPREAFVEKLRDSLQKKRDVMVAELSKLKKLKLYKPQGTFYSFPDFSAYEKDSTKLAGMLLDKALVVTVPGIEFGLEGHLRLSYCGAEKDIIEGVSRIRKVLD